MINKPSIELDLMKKNLKENNFNLQKIPEDFNEVMKMKVDLERFEIFLSNKEDLKKLDIIDANKTFTKRKMLTPFNLTVNMS